jgi:phosphoribosylformimino-5-aminoimidazole carboxamide ribotide isomerase
MYPKKGRREAITDFWDTPPNNKPIIVNPFFMIQIIASLTIAGGKVVKTVKGNIDELKVYDENPLDMAMNFEAQGFKRLHMIDLDGAKVRKVVNYKLLQVLTQYTKLEIDFSGGITTDDAARTAFECGAKYITTASVPVHENDKFKEWLITYGGKKIILAADSREGIVHTGGWKKHTGIDLYNHRDLTSTYTKKYAINSPI